MNKKKKFFGILIFLAVFAAATAIVMLLWNALIPSIIGWTCINYWQAAGLMLLSRLLLGGFGGFRKFGRFGHHHRGHHKMKRKEMIAFREKMKDMSRDERREYIRERMRPDFFGREDNTEPKE